MVGNENFEHDTLYQQGREQIEIAYLPKLAPGADSFDDFDLEEADTQIYTRQLRLPMSALNLAAILSKALDEDAEGEEEEEEDFEDNGEDLPGDSQATPDLPEDLDALDLLKDIKSLGLPEDFDPSLLEQLIP